LSFGMTNTNPSTYFAIIFLTPHEYKNICMDSFGVDQFQSMIEKNLIILGH